MPDRIVLHTYFRSTASYRVRIALNLKGLSYETVSHNLRKGEQRHPDYCRVNPQGLVPALEINGRVLTQSLAICEFLDEIYPARPLLPQDVWERAQVRALAQVIACDVHPVQNLKVLARLRAEGLGEDAARMWAADVIGEGLAAFDALLGQNGPFCTGEAITLADLLLVPQLVNARRFGVDLKWPRLLEVEANCLADDAFARARPECQPDAD